MERPTQGYDPELIEDHIFRINLTLPKSIENTVQSGLAENVGTRLAEGLAEGLVESQRAIIELIQRNPRITKREMATHVGISTTAIDKNIEAMKKKGRLQRVGPDKGGHWELLP